MGRDKKSLQCDPGSELRLGREEKRTAKMKINEMAKKKRKTSTTYRNSWLKIYSYRRSLCEKREKVYQGMKDKTPKFIL